jgi:hypothetical protein
MEILKGFWEYLSIPTLIVIGYYLAVIITKMTPSKKDDELLEKGRKIIDIALNVFFSIEKAGILNLINKGKKFDKFIAGISEFEDKYIQTFKEYPDKTAYELAKEIFKVTADELKEKNINNEFLEKLKKNK